MIKGLNYYWFFIRNQHKTKQSLDALQNKQLKKIILHAYKSVAFYRNMMNNAGVKPEQINCASDLQRLPTVSKSQIQKEFQSYISDQYTVEKCIVKTTSGSSGKALTVLWDKNNFWARVFLFYRTFAMIGYNPFRRALYFSFEADDVGFTFGLFRNKHLYLDQPFEETRKILLSYQPHIISMYPSYALDLGKYLTAEDIDQMKIRAVSLNSETILAKDKAQIRKIYQCPVYEEYSTVETGMIASSCKYGGMHIFTDNVVLEILDHNDHPVAPGERGDVVLTTLNSYAMPFIRYRIGDSASILPYMCQCGSPFPLLGVIEGRNDEAFIMSDGTRIPAWKIYEIVERPLAHSRNKHIVYDFYIVQKDYELADFYYVKGPGFQQSYISGLVAKSREVFGPDFMLRINEVDNIDRVRSVKRKYIHVDMEKK